MKNKKDTFEAFLRCFHALPSPVSLDVYLDDVLYIKDFLYEDFSHYKPLAKGEHQISITLHEQTNILCTRSIWISNEKIYTLIISTDFKTLGPGLYLINDAQRPIPNEHCLLRLGTFCNLLHLVNIQFSEQTLAFRKISPHQSSHYLSFTPGTYDITALTHEKNDTVCELKNSSFKISRIYTLYLLGNASDNYPLHFLLSIDGSSFLSF